MKVIDLRCRHEHRFEGWFASDDDLQAQRDRGLLECPFCGDREVSVLPSAPRLNLRSVGGSEIEPAAESEGDEINPETGSGTPEAQAVQAMWLTAVRHLMSQTEDVGARFAEEARRIHYGESSERAIRGQSSPEERAALADEGIEVHTLPVPKAWSGPVQ